MNRYHKHTPHIPNISNISVFCLLLLALMLICSACTSGSTISTTKPAATPTAAQPITGQQILAGPLTYVALGASDAVGIGSDEPGSQGYVPLLAARLPQGSHLVNLGISGIHLHQAIQQELPIALTTAPKLVTIWLVANDFVAGVPYDSYMRDLDSLLKQLRSGTQARLVMANLPNLALLPDFANLTTTQKNTMLTAIQRWDAQIGTIAARYNVTLVDLFGHNSQLTSHPEYISADGFHPSPKGYVQLADIFWAAIKG